MSKSSKIQIVHKPGSTWLFRFPSGAESQKFSYDQRGLWKQDEFVYIGQTCYYGEEKVWLVQREVECESVDETV